MSPCLGVILLVLVIALPSMSSYTEQKNWIDDCKLSGVHRVGEEVYECKPRATAPATPRQ